MEHYGYSEDQCSLNDACVIAYLLDRRLFSGRRAHVSIEHNSGLTSGMSVVDLNGVTRKTPNVLWIDAADSRATLELLHATLARHAKTGRP
jgi:purine nucleosidase